MRAVVVHPPRPGVELGEVPEPSPGPGEVKISTLECGICGTDRDIVAGKYGRAPDGANALVLGHENLGRVAEVGRGVSGWTPGELVVATVRRGCGRCRFCRSDRSDFCETGEFTERGIWKRDGFLSDAYVEIPEYLVHVPEALRPVAVLLEPLSVVEKALEEARFVLDRREAGTGPRTGPLRTLIAGTGAIGMLAAFRLRADGSDVIAIDRHGGDTPAARLLGAIGARHVDASKGLGSLGRGGFDMIVEAGGSAVLDFELLPLLGPNGVLVLTGIPAADTPPFAVPGGALLRDLVLKNQAVVGSVNANRSYFEEGARDLARFQERFGDALGRLISARRPLKEFDAALSDPSSGLVKIVLTISG